MPTEVPKGSLYTMMRACGAALVVAMVVAIVPAIAHFPPTPDDQQDNSPAGGKNKKGAPVAGPTITGNWTGQLNQVGSQTPYKFELSVTAKGAETNIRTSTAPALTRVGQSKSYVFFVEVITKGQADKGGRCPDGTVTVARQGDDLALGWFGSIQGSNVIAYGTLKKK